jgi:hypothetical protein
VIRFEEELDRKQDTDDQIFMPDERGNEVWAQAQSEELFFAEEQFEGWLAFGEITEISDDSGEVEEDRDVGEAENELIDEREKALNDAIWVKFNKEQSIGGDMPVEDAVNELETEVPVNFESSDVLEYHETELQNDTLQKVENEMAPQKNGQQAEAIDVVDTEIGNGAKAIVQPEDAGLQYNGWLAFGEPSEIPQEIIRYEEEREKREHIDDQAFEPSEQGNELWIQNQSEKTRDAGEVHDGWLAFGEPSELSDDLLKAEEGIDMERVEEEPIDEEERAMNAAVWEKFNKELNLTVDAGAMVALSHQLDSSAEQRTVNRPSQEILSDVEVTVEGAKQSENVESRDETRHEVETIENAADQDDFPADEAEPIERKQVALQRGDNEQGRTRPGQLYDGWLAFGSPSEIPQEVIRFEEERDRLPQDAENRVFEPDEQANEQWTRIQAERHSETGDLFEGWLALGTVSELSENLATSETDADVENAEAEPISDEQKVVNAAIWEDFNRELTAGNSLQDGVAVLGEHAEQRSEARPIDGSDPNVNRNETYNVMKENEIEGHVNEEITEMKKDDERLTGDTTNERLEPVKSAEDTRPKSKGQEIVGSEQMASDEAKRVSKSRKSRTYDGWLAYGGPTEIPDEIQRFEAEVYSLPLEEELRNDQERMEMNATWEEFNSALAEHRYSSFDLESSRHSVVPESATDQAAPDNTVLTEESPQMVSSSQGLGKSGSIENEKMREERMSCEYK